MSSKIEMVLFDIDGTLCDTVDITYNCINEILEKNNIKEKVKIEDVRDGQGLNKENFSLKCMPFLEKELRENILNEANKIKMKKIREEKIYIYNNVKETIIELSKKYKIGIVSNCGYGYIEEIISKIGIKEYIDDYIAASIYGISKSEAMKIVIKRNNINSAIYVGDTELDKEESIKAGLKFVYAKYGFGKSIKSEKEIDKFEDLLNIL